MWWVEGISWQKFEEICRYLSIAEQIPRAWGRCMWTTWYEVYHDFLDKNLPRLRASDKDSYCFLVNAGNYMVEIVEEEGTRSRKDTEIA